MNNAFKHREVYKFQYESFFDSYIICMIEKSENKQLRFFVQFIWKSIKIFAKTCLLNFAIKRMEYRIIFLGDTLPYRLLSNTT